MTIRQKLTALLEERGLSPERATAAFCHYAAQPFTRDMEGRWDDDVDDHPLPLIGALALVLRRQVFGREEIREIDPAQTRQNEQKASTE